jgi:hypothetical protein
MCIRKISGLTVSKGLPDPVMISLPLNHSTGVDGIFRLHKQHVLFGRSYTLYARYSRTGCVNPSFELHVQLPHQGILMDTPISFRLIPRGISIVWLSCDRFVVDEIYRCSRSCSCSLRDAFSVSAASIATITHGCLNLDWFG